MNESASLIDQSGNETEPIIEDDLEEPEETGNPDGSECRIGIESIPNSANHYRLGMTFLKHFYTALDYENNLIILGLNGVGGERKIQIYKDAAAKIREPLPDDDYHALVSICVVVLIAVFIWLYVLSVKHRRRKEPGYVPKILRAGIM